MATVSTDTTQVFLDMIEQNRTDKLQGAREKDNRKIVGEEGDKEKVFGGLVKSGLTTWLVAFDKE